MRQKTVITKLLQSVTEAYYKVRQVLQSASGITKCDRMLLQSASGITKWDSYYKVRCNTGRVFGKTQHKEQLNQVKLQAVKEVTFTKYPRSPYLMDITWKKECITATDSGLRNENRGNRAQVIITQEVANNIQKSDEINVVETELKI